MAAFTYTVSKNGTTIQNVQEISWTMGRRLVTDQLSSSRYRISGRMPTSLPTINIDDTIKIDWGVSYFELLVADFEIIYGINSNADIWVITGEDALAKLGRSEITMNLSSDVAGSLLNVEAATGVVFTPRFGSAGTQVQTISNTNALEIVSKLFTTEMASNISVTTTNVFWNTRGLAGILPLPGPTATDQTPGVNEWKYDGLTFGGLADNYATKVIATSAGVGTATAGTGTRTYSLTTYNSSTSYLASVAQMYAGYLGNFSVAPDTISFLAESQTTTPLDLYAVDLSFVRRPVLTIKFRGVNYYAVTIGMTVTATPSSTRLTYNLAPSQALSYFILNSTSRGVLNQNRLGF